MPNSAYIIDVIVTVMTVVMLIMMMIRKSCTQVNMVSPYMQNASMAFMARKVRGINVFTLH
jgi:hypothetical protein